MCNGTNKTATLDVEKNKYSCNGLHVKSYESVAVIFVPFDIKCSSFIPSPRWQMLQFYLFRCTLNITVIFYRIVQREKLHNNWLSNTLWCVTLSKYEFRDIDSNVTVWHVSKNVNSDTNICHRDFRSIEKCVSNLCDYDSVQNHYADILNNSHPDTKVFRFYRTASYGYSANYE